MRICLSHRRYWNGKTLKSLRKISEQIGEVVRETRRKRGWAQAELAERLELSQPRLSEIERGVRDLSAAQFLRFLEITNTSITRFLVEIPSEEAALQNALVRHGATHLRQLDAFPTAPDSAGALVVEVLGGAPSPRHVSALAPVLVRSADAISLPEVARRLRHDGRAHRLGWLVESVHEVIGAERPRAEDRRMFRRADTLLASFQRHETVRPPPPDQPIDMLDRDIRTLATADQVFDEASPTARRWRIATRLRAEDFANALRASSERR